MTLTPMQFIRNRDEYLPALPATAAQVLSITADPESSAEELMQAVLPDQSMCAAILKIANSAFLGIPRTVSSIKQALVVLGQTEVRNLVVARAVCNAFPDLSKEQMKEVNLFWEHSFACGLLSMTMAPAFRVAPGEFFLAGLIHGIGKLPLVTAFPETAHQLHILTCDNCLEEEKQAFGTTHQQIGLNLTYKWNFPSPLIAAIAWHHRFEEAPGHHEFPLAVTLAKILVRLAEDGADGERAASHLHEEHLITFEACSARGVELTPDVIDGWYEELARRRKEDSMILDLLRS